MLRTSFRKAIGMLVRTKVKLAAERRKDITAGNVSCHATGKNRSGRGKDACKTNGNELAFWEGNK